MGNISISDGDKRVGKWKWEVGQKRGESILMKSRLEWKEEPQPHEEWENGSEQNEENEAEEEEGEEEKEEKK